MSFINRRHTLLAFALTALGFFTAFPQSPTGQITGRITDATGAVVPFAEITVVNTETGLVRKTASNETGYFTASLLPPGEYRINVRKTGFRAAARSGVTLAVDQVARLDFQLEVGNVSDSVDVTAEAPTVDASTASLGTVVSSEQIKNLPLNSRDPLRFIYLVP